MTALVNSLPATLHPTINDTGPAQRAGLRPTGAPYLPTALQGTALHSQTSGPGLRQDRRLASRAAAKPPETRETATGAGGRD
ncbi:hypothetical protein FRACA_780021 [Frankia canadensis]|uniref:Uncharacterized protein n=1 Tax=Frankia canadensis TaxID=1836972 RepID=A0A2I2L170_9ACTN|nr:hypothetical protein FRACA_780021 [Frankia canadensis]SOU58954.1 hypothetical protein FRACA_780021 [Frankia canadensis]